MDSKMHPTLLDPKGKWPVRLSPTAPNHVPGWSWFKELSGRVAFPWRSLVGCQGRGLAPEPGAQDRGQPFVSGICQHGWHRDCQQAPYEPDHLPADCSGDHLTRCCCPCHLWPETLF